MSGRGLVILGIIALAAVRHVDAAPPDSKFSSPAVVAKQEKPTEKSVQRKSLKPGTHARTLTVGDMEREYLIHIPRSYREKTPAAVVLAFHGAMMNARMMPRFCGLNETAEKEGFVVVYPNGTGTQWFRVWNAGGLPHQFAAPAVDDVKFVSQLLDDLPRVVAVDPDRVYATGMSNGGMMCYRLACELSERIAAIAPVAGTMAIKGERPARPISVIHFHGDQDTLVPFEGPRRIRGLRVATFRSVPDSLKVWRKYNGCEENGRTEKLPDKSEDGTTVERTIWGPGREKSEVVLYEIQGGGHTWPGKEMPLQFLGRTTKEIDANKLIWEFFKKHPRKQGR